MAINNTIHRLSFSRRVRTLYLDEYTVDDTTITSDVSVYSADKTHDIVKL